jgi:peptidoglycan-associated lipoprotein
LFDNRALIAPFLMKIAAKLFTLVFISAAVLFSGCSKKPTRPSPDQTLLGPQGGGASVAALNPSDVPTTLDNSQLTPRGDGVLEDEFTIRGLLKPVYFDFDKSAVKASERIKLDEAAKYLSEHPEHRLLLEGHCDWRGTAEYNLGLGDRRAGAAKQYLTGHNVAAAKLESLSKGSLDAAKNATDDQMAKDRRVELVILKK